MAKKQLKTVLLLLFACWIFFAFARTLFNLSKLITEEPKWYFLSNEQKKEKQFGEKHDFFRFVQRNTTKNSNILLFTNDGMTYYLARYYLYPTTVIWGERQFTEWGDDINRDYGYVIYFPYLKREAKDTISVNNRKYYKQNEFFYNNELRGVIYKK